MAAYYNENNREAAEWLRELIRHDHIADGEVDERSIEDVVPKDVARFNQAHFFAGIGGWSRALRLAGWPDDRPVWTGSCPCQPFSAAGKRKGTSDERHLWPAWFWLIEKCRPPIVFGEQVADAIRSGWLDLISSDLEGAGYSVGSAVLAAGGFGAPHIRKRLWFVANTDGTNAGAERKQHGGEPRLFEKDSIARELANTVRTGRPEGRAESGHLSTARSRLVGELAYAASIGFKRWRPVQKVLSEEPLEESERLCNARELGDACGEGAGRNAGAIPETQREASVRAVSDGALTPSSNGSLWADCDWIYCTDGKWRPVEPGSFPLAHGIPERLGQLRGYGNAIVPQVAAAFIQASQNNGE